MRVPGEVVDTVTRYYFNDRWQVVMETDEEGATRREFVYGNGIDEPLILIDGMTAGEPLYYYVQDHLNSTVALLDESAEVAERYEYDVYGKPSVWVRDDLIAGAVMPAYGGYDEAAWAGVTEDELAQESLWRMEPWDWQFAPVLYATELPEYDPVYDPNDSLGMLLDPNTVIDAEGLSLGGLEMPAMSVAGPTSELTASAVGSVIGNPYYFTGRRLDILDGGAKLIQINRHRYYDYRTGRWLSVDPLGVVPGDTMNGFSPLRQYTDGVNLYEYVKSGPMMNGDLTGLSEDSYACCKIKGPEHGKKVYTHTTYMHGDPIQHYKTISDCKQVSVPRGEKQDAMAACQCKYGNSSSTVYGAHKGTCCWCGVYFVTLESTWAHKVARVKCFKHGIEKSWDIHVMPGELFGFKQAGFVFSIVQTEITHNSDLGAKWEFAGAISCDAADKLKKGLVDQPWIYTAQHACGRYARQIIEVMLKECP